MKVVDLRQHLNDLAKLLEASGGAKPAKDLAALADALAPFADQSPADFTKFLTLAHEYHTTGKLSAPPKAARAPRAAKTKADPAQAAGAVRDLYDRSGDLSLTMDEINAGLTPLDALQKPGLLEVCRVMEIQPRSKWTVVEIRSAIKQKVLDRRSAAQRAAMIEGANERAE